MLRSVENPTHFVFPDLRHAFMSGNDAACRQLLKQVPDGVVLEIDQWIFELPTVLPEEIELMERSRKKRREMALILTTDRKEIIEGKHSEVDGQPILRIVKTLPAEEHLITSHTHWFKRERNPFPSFEDIRAWQALAEVHSNIDCRVVFYQGETIRAIRYKGLVPVVPLLTGTPIDTETSS